MRPHDWLDIDHFWARVDKRDDCWVWTGRLDRPQGYGMCHLKIAGKWREKAAHRISYELCVGLIPEGMEIDHLCFNRSCVKPDHLRPVTPKQNQEHRSGPPVRNTSGVMGVSWHKGYKRWVASVGHLGKKVHVGTFQSLDDAAAAVKAKRDELYTHHIH